MNIKGVLVKNQKGLRDTENPATRAQNHSRAMDLTK